MNKVLLLELSAFVQVWIWKKAIITLSFAIFFAATSLGQLSVSFDIDEPSCFGLPNGTIKANVTGGIPPYTYTWDTGQTTPILLNISSNTYTVTINDTAGNTVAQTAFLGQPDLISLDFDEEICQTPFNLSGIANGGVPPYHFNWSTGASTSTITNLSAGNYRLTLSDSAGCGRVGSIDLGNDSLNLTTESQNVTCFEGNDGTATVIPNTSGSYTYFWSNGEFTSFITNLIAGTYFVTVTNTSGCLAVDSVIITQPEPLFLQINGEDLNCFGIPDGSANVIATGGTPDYDYQWSNGENTASIDMLFPEHYEVTVTDNHGCMAITDIVITQPSALSLAIEATDETCTNCDDGTATAIISGGKPPYQYLWSTGEEMATISHLAPGTYTLIITDANHCTITAAVTIGAAFFNSIPVEERLVIQKEITSLISTSVNDNTIDEGFLVKAYPMPVLGELSLLFEENSYQNVQITLFSITGKLVLQENIERTKLHTLKLMPLPAGQYFLRLIYDEQQVELVKIVKI